MGRRSRSRSPRSRRATSSTVAIVSDLPSECDNLDVHHLIHPFCSNRATVHRFPDSRKAFVIFQNSEETSKCVGYYKGERPIKFERHVLNWKLGTMGDFAMAKLQEPGVVEDTEADLVPADVAGADDTSGMMAELEKYAGSMGVDMNQVFNMVSASGAGAKGNSSDTALITGMKPGDSSIDDLGALFSCYGNCVRGQIIRDKKSNALVMLESDEQCSRAVRNLNGISLRGKKIKVELSTKKDVPELRDASSAERKYMEDWSKNDAYNRFNGRNDPNPSNLPCAYVRVDQLPANVELMTLLTTIQDNTDQEVDDVRFVDRREKSAVLKFPSTSAAVDAIVKLHAVELEGTILLLSFSNKSEFDELDA